MNRTIKFRVWNPEDRKWIDISEVTRFSLYDHNPYLLSWDIYDGMHISYHWNGGERGETQESCSCTINQYIGLNDINDKYIYEGDIVQFVLEDSRYGDKITALVCYDNSSAAFVFRKCIGIGTYDYNVSEDKINTDSFEVIGNIFESPELLK